MLLKKWAKHRMFSPFLSVVDGSAHIYWMGYIGKYKKYSLNISQTYRPITALNIIDIHKIWSKLIHKY